LNLGHVTGYPEMSRPPPYYWYLQMHAETATSDKQHHLPDPYLSRY